jgi:SAM-dependent methyltransferase
MATWHDDDTFWERMAPFMFPAERWAATPAEIDRVEALLGIQPPAEVLDVGCGPGRHSLELARRGYRVTGIDRTTAYLARARRAAEKDGLQVEFVRDDMRRFARVEAYDAALSLFTSFGYFEDPAENRQVLANVCASLRPGGVLLMDLHGKETLAPIFSPRGWEEIDGVYFLQERAVERDWSWMRNRWIRIDADGVSEYEVCHWIYSARELREMLRDSGFARVTVYGDLGGGPYDHTARRLVAVAQR